MYGLPSNSHGYAVPVDKKVSHPFWSLDAEPAPGMYIRYVPGPVFHR